jgi:YbbR-like protein
MNRLRRFFTQHAGLKLLSLAMAVALWAAVGSDPVTEATFRVPVEFINVPPSLELLTEQPSVQLWARGPSHAIRQAAAGDFAVRVNAAPITGPGSRTYSIDPGHVVAPNPLQVIALIPSEIRVSFERSVSKDIPIQPRFSGDPLPGYRMKGFSVHPPQARVSGPESHVKSIAIASTDPVEVGHLSGQTIFVTALSVSDPLVRILEPRTVEVTVEIGRDEGHGAGPPATRSGRK